MPVDEILVALQIPARLVELRLVLHQDRLGDLHLRDTLRERRTLRRVVHLGQHLAGGHTLALLDENLL